MRRRFILNGVAGHHTWGDFFCLALTEVLFYISSSVGGRSVVFGFGIRGGITFVFVSQLS